MQMHIVIQLVDGKGGTGNQGSRLQTRGSLNRLAVLRINLISCQPDFI